MNDSDLISVVVPIYNVEQYLDECIKSIISQTYRNLEIILVNDGSTDSSPEICERYSMQDSRIRLLHQENGGLSVARNTGIKSATGKYITFIDSDDAIRPNMIQYLYRDLIQNHADMAVCQKEYVDEDMNVISSKSVVYDDVIEGSDQCMKKFFSDSGLDTTAWGKLYRLEHFDNVQYPPGKYHEDVYTTYLLIAQCNRIAICSERMYLYRQRASSIVHQDFSLKHLDSVDASLERAQYIEKHFPEEKVYANAMVVYSANQCALKVIHSAKKVDSSVMDYLQKQYRSYEKYFLRGQSRMMAKLFSLCAYISLEKTVRMYKLFFKK